MVDAPAAEYPHCGCCGRARPAARLTRLDSSPGVYLCLGCALSAVWRLGRVPLPRLNFRAARHRLQQLAGGHHHEPGGVPGYGMAIPIFPVTDLDRSVPYYLQLGFRVVERLADYAVLATGGSELHLNQAQDRTTDEAFLHVDGDPTNLWTQLEGRAVPGLGPVRDQPWGLREFVATDPDGNTLRIGHPTPD